MRIGEIVATFFGENATMKRRAEGERLVRFFMEELRRELKDTDRCIVPGLGTIHIRHHKARPAKDPRNGKMLERCKERYTARIRLANSVNDELLRARDKRINKAIESLRRNLV